MLKKIHVTQEDIKNGKDRDYNSCPIALAMKRELNTDRVVVDYSTSTYCLCKDIRHECGCNGFNNSSRMKRFIDRFDNYKHVRPTTFIINLKEIL